jgi:crotonobetainyl-CoA:carnitine CoA-transferase CaiB-like acyl-CoA transferase
MSNSPLQGLKVLDLSRILAGPTATQLLGDLGADVVKVEKPGEGDDTRKWGPPYLGESNESAYYLSCNRNKRSLALDFTTPEGQATLKQLAQQTDVLLENYKVGTLAKYGLDYAALSALNPRLIYCSLTGFGQTGPYANRAGYDFMVQGMGGIMSLTGEPDGAPMKVGVAVADMMAGMYAVTGILAALHARHSTGKGQYIDVALLDTQVAWLGNAGQQYLTSGNPPARWGNAHPTIVPYEVFAVADGHVILAIGNDSQFAKFCNFAGQSWDKDPCFATNSARVKNRADLVPHIRTAMLSKTKAEWLVGLEALGVPCGPINRLPDVFTDPQVNAREMLVSMNHPDSAAPITLIGNPLKFSDTPVSYRHAPPSLGQQNTEILLDWLGKDQV